ncbi:hypothetical protein CDAR_456701 [Caerostris darwini]|uniref:Uncharacterized protein n=1 Tax=Caerostris darwini TaxID=1538125 RepID=A0AAV4W9J6_9ARAC|nr:hypothetical protein CDAR_456701 [Caerostris darwini]
MENLKSNGYMLAQLHLFNQLEGVDNELSNPNSIPKHMTRHIHNDFLWRSHSNGGAITESSEFMLKSVIGYNGIQHSCICGSSVSGSDTCSDSSSDSSSDSCSDSSSDSCSDSYSSS